MPASSSSDAFLATESAELDFKFQDAISEIDNFTNIVNTGMAHSIVNDFDDDDMLLHPGLGE